MASRCAFCNRSDLTHEHVFPDWIYAAAGADSVQIIDEETIRPLKSLTIRRRPGSRAGHTTKKVCAGCNNGWMSSLERRAKPVLLPLVQGRAVSLLPPGCQVVAQWLVKTVLVCELTRSGPSPIVFDSQHREQFREALAPLPGTLIWIGVYDGAVGASFHSEHPVFKGSLEKNVVRTLSQGCAATITVGRLIGQVLWVGDGYDPTIAYELVFRGDWTDRMIQIWPTRGPCTFDNLRPLDDRALERFCKRWTIL